MRALSWSVLKVCSSRPSEPMAIQHQGTPGSARSSAVVSMTRMVSRSLRVVMKWMSVSAPVPWASRPSASRRMPAAAACSAGQVAGRLDLLAHLVDAGPLQAEEVVAGDGAEQAPRAVHHHQVAHAEPGHGEGRLVGGGARPQGDAGRRS